MEINYKKIGLIAGFIAVVIILGFGIYYIFFSAPLATITTDTAQPPASGGQLPQPGIKTDDAGASPDIGSGGGLPDTGGAPAQTPAAKDAVLADEVANGSLTKTSALNNSNSRAPTIAGNGRDVLYYNKDDGKFYRLNQNGVAALLSDKTFFNAENIIWSPDKNKALIEYPDGSNIVYNFSTGKQFSLEKHWEDFDFAPNGGQIVAKSIGSDPSNRWLVVSNEDGSQAKAIEPLGEKDASVHPSWSPNNLSIAIYTESIDFDRQTLYFVGLNKENFKSTIIEGRGLEHKWNSDGSKLLYSVYSSTTQLKPSLWAVGAKADDIGANRQPLELQTWAHKCAFAGKDIVYCAVPNTLPEGAGLFPELAQNSVDSLYKINLANGSTNLIAVPDQSYNVSDLMVSEDESILYFTDSSSGRLHKMKLK